MEYYFSAPDPGNHFIHITAIKNITEDGIMEFQLAAWRPGRYELQNFAKNLRKLTAEDENGKKINIYKIAKDKWKIDHALSGKVILNYEYYAAQADAGACWCDNELLYVNPVHCIIYDPSSIYEECSIQLHIPADWKIACALKETDTHKLIAANYHELADSPFFASATLQHSEYKVSDHRFHIWFQGECLPDWKRILNDFIAFTKVQLDMMIALPTVEYHFLILILPYRYYHGVEHVSSTVLALGPGYKLMDAEIYSDLLGVASHELFHAWNVKTLRPADFLNYDYTKENYSKLGWVYEGFTTYYGDLFLARSQFFNTSSYFEEINARLQRHVDNYGRFNISVSHSSYDTWLDGYVPGVPQRKTSIYDEGCLIAMLLDLYIRRNTNNKKSLDTFFVQLYNDFAKHNHGYQEQDLRALAENMAGKEVLFLFDELINKAESYENKIMELLDYVGCYIQRIESRFAHEEFFGLRTITEAGIVKVHTVVPDSPAAKSGLAKDDEIIACNNWRVENNLHDLVRAGGKQAELIAATQKKIRHVKLIATGKTYFDIVSIQLIDDASEGQKEAFTSWTNLKINEE